MPYCFNCGNEISDQAIMCPKCGHPGPAHRPAGVSLDFGPVVAAPYARWGTRAGAYLIDLVLVFAVFAVLAGIAFAGLQLGETAVVGAGFFFVTFPLFGLVSVVYKPLMEGKWGQTLGKMAVGIRVVRAADATPIGYGEAFLRWIIGAVIGFVPFGTAVDLLWPLWDQYNQTLHDKVAKTIVVSDRPV